MVSDLGRSSLAAIAGGGSVGDMSRKLTRAKRFLDREAEFERLAEAARTSTMREEYRATAAQYRRLAVAEAGSAGTGDRERPK
jgi:hypothetical protein